MTFYFKKEGIERIPNVHFWMSLPGLAKDGVLFVYQSLLKLCGKGSGSYENVA